MLRILAAIALFTLGTAQANEGLYIGVNYASVDYEETGFPTVSPTAIAFRIGNELNKNVAVEARLGTGLSDDTVTVSGVGIAVEVDNFFGAYVRGILPLGRISPYGLIGYTKGEVTARVGNISVSDDDSDFSYGLGADFNLNKTSAINVEWAKLFSGADFDVYALSVGYKYSF